jgi:integrase
VDEDARICEDGCTRKGRRRVNAPATAQEVWAPMQHADYGRRTAVAKHPGVFVRARRDGSKTYGFYYRDSDGRLHPKTVGPNLAQAVAAQAKMRTRLAEGERVAPSRDTFETIARAWLASKGKIREATRRRYEWAIEKHLVPRFGDWKMASVTTDDVALLVADLERKGMKPWTVRAVLGPLNGICKYAYRRGMIAANPVAALEGDERPAAGGSRKRALTADEIRRLLVVARGLWRMIFATMIFTGLRPSEALGLRWQSIDFDEGLIDVSHQLAKDRRTLVAPKTESSIRKIILLPELARMLREHRMASPYKAPTDFVFTMPGGIGVDRNLLARKLAAALEKAGIANVQPRDFRHSFAALLIDRQATEGYSDEFIAAQLGHKDSAITRKVYSYLFEPAKHADAARDGLSAAFGGLLK